MDKPTDPASPHRDQAPSALPSPAAPVEQADLERYLHSSTGEMRDFHRYVHLHGTIFFRDIIVTGDRSECPDKPVVITQGGEPGPYGQALPSPSRINEYRMSIVDGAGASAQLVVKLRYHERETVKLLHQGAYRHALESGAKAAGEQVELMAAQLGVKTIARRAIGERERSRPVK